MRDNVRYLYTDRTGQTIQPVIFDEVADLEHNYTLTEPQRENQLTPDGRIRTDFHR